LRIKEQEKRLTLQEHDDDDEKYYLIMPSKPQRLWSVGDESMNMEYWCNGTDSGISKYLIKSAVHVTYQFLCVETFSFLRKQINTNMSFTVS